MMVTPAKQSILTNSPFSYAVLSDEYWSGVDDDESSLGDALTIGDNEFNYDEQEIAKWIHFSADTYFIEALDEDLSAASFANSARQVSAGCGQPYYDQISSNPGVTSMCKCDACCYASAMDATSSSQWCGGCKVCHFEADYHHALQNLQHSMKESERSRAQLFVISQEQPKAESFSGLARFLSGKSSALTIELDRSRKQLQKYMMMATPVINYSDHRSTY